MHCIPGGHLHSKNSNIAPSLIMTSKLKSAVKRIKSRVSFSYVSLVTTNIKWAYAFHSTGKSAETPWENCFLSIHQRYVLLFLYLAHFIPHKWNVLNEATERGKSNRGGNRNTGYTSNLDIQSFYVSLACVRKNMAYYEQLQPIVYVHAWRGMHCFRHAICDHRERRYNGQC